MNKSKKVTSISEKVLKNKPQSLTKQKNDAVLEKKQKIDLLRLPIYKKNSKMKRKTQYYHSYNPNKIYSIRQNQGVFQKTISSHQFDKTIPVTSCLRNSLNSVLNNQKEKKSLSPPEKKKDIVVYTKKLKIWTKKLDQSQIENSLIYKDRLKKRNVRNSLQKDSQSIIKKNSLFLTTFIKRQSKQFFEEPHIGNFQNSAIKVKCEPKPEKKQKQNIRGKQKLEQRIELRKKKRTVKFTADRDREEEDDRTIKMMKIEPW